MTREEFLIEMLDVLQREDEPTFDMELQDLDEWDSLAVMATMAFLDKQFGVKTTLRDYEIMKTVEDIAAKAGL